MVAISALLDVCRVAPEIKMDLTGFPRAAMDAQKEKLFSLADTQLMKLVNMFSGRRTDGTL
jgi:hypothetical protein